MSTLPRILFVDDEPEILHSLRNVLRRDRGRWDLSFATSGEMALSMFAEASFDIVVSDMRMPQMNGAELLDRVRDQYPGTARLVLSGHADRKLLMRALPVTHQYLSKPCDTQILREALERICELQERVSHPAIREFVSWISGMPYQVATQQALYEAAENPATRLEDYVALIECEPALAIKVLQIVNSMYFTSGRPTVSIRESIQRLGTDLLRTLTLEAKVFAMPIGVGEVVPNHAPVVRAAKLARQLAVDPAHGEAAYCAALLRELGTHVVQLYHALGRKTDPARTCPPQTEVGAFLLALWGVPDLIVDLVAQHHEPTRAQNIPPEVVAAMQAAAKVIEAESR